MAKEWTPDLAIGINEIDSQHKVLFHHVNQLLTAMQQGTGPEGTRKILSFLAAYVVTHFATEEKYMAQFHYSGLTAHCTQHQTFTQEVDGYMSRFDADGATNGLIQEVHRRVTDWLVNHIQKTDKLMGTFVASKMTATADV